MEEGEAELREQIRSTEDVEDVFYPARAYFDRDVYAFSPPHPQLYAVGVIVDPCKGTVPDCCMNRFGSPVYPWVKRELVDYYPRVRGPGPSF